MTPLHPGSTGVRLYFYRYERGRWKLRKTVTAKAVPASPAESRYSVRTYLQGAGSWRVRAYHADTGHAPAYSGYRKLRAR